MHTEQLNNISWNLAPGKLLLLIFFSWKSGLNLHWISMTSLSKHLEVLQPNGNVGPQTQFYYNSELFSSFRKVEDWPLSRPQAVHSAFQTGHADKVQYYPCLSERVQAQILLKTDICTGEQLHCHDESCAWLERLLNTVVWDFCQVSQSRNGTLFRAMWIV